MHVFTIGEDMVVAADAADAFEAWLEFTDRRAENVDETVDDVSQLEDERPVEIWVNADGHPGEVDGINGETVTKTSAEWAAQEGRGFLCSPNF